MILEIDRYSNFIVHTPNKNINGRDIGMISKNQIDNSLIKQTNQKRDIKNKLNIYCI